MTDRVAGTTSSAGDGLPPRGSLRLVFDRQFGALFWGKLLSSTGVWVHSIVAAVVIYAATGSALWVGLISVVQFGPQLILSPLSGKWADRGNMARQLLVGRALCTVGSAAVAVQCIVVGEPQGYGEATAVLLASLVTGLGFVVGGPAQQSMIPLVIRPGELSIAMALNSLPMTLARVAGPVLGAAVLFRWGAAEAFVIAAVSHLVFVVLLLVAALPPGTGRPREGDLSVRAALVHVRGDRTLVLLLLVVAATGFAAEPSITLVPAFAAALGGDSELVGQLTGAFGLGSVVGYVAYVRMSHHLLQQPRLAQLGLFLMTAGTLLLAFVRAPLAGLVLFGVVGSGFMIANTAATTLIQERVPAALRGRVMALWFMGFIGSRPFAALMDGHLADAYGLAVPLLVTVGLLILLMLAFRPRGLDFSPAARQAYLA